MAQRVNIILVDDIDGSEATQTVTFGLRGVTYEIDLSDAHAGELETAMEKYIVAGRRVGGRRQQQRRSAAKKGSRSQEIRAWAQAQGLDVADRGRVPEDIVAKYDAAHA